MPRINLLPTRISRRQARARRELLVMSVLFSFLLTGLTLWHRQAEQQVSKQETHLQSIKVEIQTLKEEAKRMASFKEKSDELTAKLNAIDTLQRQRTGSAMMMSDLAIVLNAQPKIWLTSLTEKNGAIELQGGAMDHEDISDFQLGLLNGSKLFTDIKLALVQMAQVGKTRYLKWKITGRANLGAR